MNLSERIILVGLLLLVLFGILFAVPEIADGFDSAVSNNFVGSFFTFVGIVFIIIIVIMGLSYFDAI